MSVMRKLVASVIVGGSLAVMAGAQAQQTQEARDARDKLRCERNALNCSDAANPLPAFDSVWIEELTWMEVRDALAAGRKTVIIPTGGVEENGPWVATGKHTYILQATCDAIARKLGNALCAPIVKLAPEPSIEARTGHALSMGTLSVELSTYEAVLTDMARSLKANGFEHIILISDNGGSNAVGMQAVAGKLNAVWGGQSVLHIPEYYQSWRGAEEMLVRDGVQKEGVSDGIHDDATVGPIMMLTAPEMLRWSARVKAGKASIDGVSLADREQVMQWGRRLVDYRATVTAEAITRAIAQASGGSSAAAAEH